MDEDDHKYRPISATTTHADQLLHGSKQDIANNNDSTEIIYPPGYRFCPSDGELIVHYLRKRINNEELPHNRIKDENIYKFNPQDLAAKHKPVGDKEWYFFTPRDRKYRNGSRPNRAAGTGYWKATGADKNVRHDNERVGLRKALVFYQGKPPKGDKTNWIMHEYKIHGPQRTRTNSYDMRLDDWVLCRIYHKEDKDSKAKAHNEGLKQEERPGSLQEKRNRTMDGPNYRIENSREAINTFESHTHQRPPPPLPPSCLANVFPHPLMNPFNDCFNGGFHQFSMYRQTQFSSGSNALMEEAAWDTTSTRGFINPSLDPFIHMNDINVGVGETPLDLDLGSFFNIVPDNDSSDDHVDFEGEDPSDDPRNTHSEHEEN